MRGPGRAVTGGVHWGVRSVCAGGVRARPRRGLHCRVSVGRGGSGWAPVRRKLGGWAYACLARVVRTAAARAECGMRAAWARVEGATLQGFEDRGTTLALSRSLSLSLALALSLARSLACSLSLARSLARLFSLSLSPRGELHRQGHHLIDAKLRPGGKSEPKTTSTHES